MVTNVQPARRRWYQFRIFPFLAGLVVCAFVIGLLAGRIKLQRAEPARIATFPKLDVFEWELPPTASRCCLRVDGTRRAESSFVDVRTVQAAIVECDDSITFHVRCGGVSLVGTYPKVNGTSQRRSWMSGRSQQIDGPTQLYTLEMLDRKQRSVKTIELVVE